jgi:hypothetical protein
MKACRALRWRTMITLHKPSLFHPIITRKSSLGTKFLVRQQVYVIAQGGYDRCDIGGFDLRVLFFGFYSLWDWRCRAAVRNSVCSRLASIRVGPDVSLRLEVGRCNSRGGLNDGCRRWSIATRYCEDSGINDGPMIKAWSPSKLRSTSV